MIIDVAKYQGQIDWDALAPHLDFVIIKVRGNAKDPQFGRNTAAGNARRMDT